MSSLSRIGVAIESDLLARFDRLVAQRGYATRSEAFRDLVRDALVREAVQAGTEQVVGTLTLVYDHHVRLLTEKLLEMQHEHHHQVVSTLHVHLDHDTCLEVLVVRGKPSEVQRLADQLLATKGVQHGQLVITARTSSKPATQST